MTKNTNDEFSWRTPRVFNGKKDVYELPDFLVTLEIHFATRHITDDQEKIGYLGRSLAGPAARWFFHLGSKEDLSAISYDTLTEMLRRHYRCSIDPYYILIELLVLNQKNSVETYNETFTQYIDLLPEGYLSEQAQIHLYLRGLKEAIRPFLRIQTPKTLMDAKEIAHDIEHLKYEANQGMRSLGPLRNRDLAQDSDAMEIDEIRANYYDKNRNKGQERSKYGTQSNKETFRKKKDRQYCIENKLCFKCQKPGHTSRECRSKMASSY